MNEQKRYKNERKFKHWEDLPLSGRRYWYDVTGRTGWFARYVKEVDFEEKTIKYYQEIYNEKDELVEIHEKHPNDKGRQKYSKE